MKRTPFKVRKPMNRCGKVGRANMEANRRIKVIAEQDELNYCELSRLGMKEFSDCLGKFTLASAHRHKRAFYKGDPELLSDKSQWVKACSICHNRIEHDKKLTEIVFAMLRGPE